VKQETPFRAVLFDWRGTLVDDPPDEWWVRTALARVGRDTGADEVAALCSALRGAAEQLDVRNGEATCDCSYEGHREWSLAWFRLAGLDDDLALGLYALDLESASHPFYPDVPFVLRALRERGCKVAVVSNIHFDVRPEFAAAGLDEHVDTFVLSFEHGMQKPDRRMFEVALDALAVGAEEAIMVGDQPSLDGGAIRAGIATWLLPADAAADRPRGLDRLLTLTG
jgi:HAD superfamily hydrolase (TIGR01509 family)